MTFDYNQRHHTKIDITHKLTLKLKTHTHKILNITLLNELTINNLTHDNIPIPNYKPKTDNIPNTFIPKHNILFLTLTTIYTYQIKTKTIITDIYKTNFSNYPNYHDKFIKTLNHTVNLNITKNIHFKTPLI